MRDRTAPSNHRFWIKLGAVFFAVLFFIVWEHVEARLIEKQVKLMRREADRLTYENGRLQTQIHHWESPSNLDQMAKNQYGMGPIDPKNRIGMATP